jgi:hypothetical protein
VYVPKETEVMGQDKFINDVLNGMTLNDSEGLDVSINSISFFLY